MAHLFHGLGPFVLDEEFDALGELLANATAKRSVHLVRNIAVESITNLIVGSSLILVLFSKGQDESKVVDEAARVFLAMFAAVVGRHLWERHREAFHALVFVGVPNSHVFPVTAKAHLHLVGNVNSIQTRLQTNLIGRKRHSHAAFMVAEREIRHGNFGLGGQKMIKPNE